MGIATLAPGLDAAIARARDALLADQRADGHWVFELEADATIPSEYILLVHHLGETPDLALEAKLGTYLRRIQRPDGGWPLHHGGPLDLSATVKGYFALKMIGDIPDSPHMACARTEILARGGAGAANVFTRLMLAMHDPAIWASVPTMPPELILLPRWFPIHLSRMAYWARTVIVPLLVLQATRARAVNLRGVWIGELFGPALPHVGPASHQKRVWAAGFGVLDRVLKAGDALWPKRLRARALAACVAFVDERLNGEEGLGAIFPAMANSAMMYAALGVPATDPRRAIARASIDKLLVVRDDEAYCQPCLSPIWDTALAAHALLECGDPASETAALAGLDWLVPLQELTVRGDWAERRPDVRPGGWAFQYANAHYPDLDDTAAVVMAMDRSRRLTARYDQAIDRGVEWTAGLQSANGGWGAIDADNTNDYLNNIPFADHGALLDPPTADVSARCVSMFAQAGERPDTARMAAALAYLRAEQTEDGSWFGRWGVNYIYGTWSALCAFNAAGVGSEDPAVAHAAAWLTRIQNADGGWGEGCDSYALDYRSHTPAPSAASQTAWALLGLMAAGATDGDAVARGIAWLEVQQDERGEWVEDGYTGGGFPRVFYLRYHGYRRYFPLWALARYRNLRASNTRTTAWGM